MNHQTDPEMPKKIAVFKFAMIAPVIHGTFDDPSAKAYFRRVTEKPLEKPDGVVKNYDYKTLEKWASQYRLGGLEALEPAQRADKGQSRALPLEAQSRILEIKCAYPKLAAVHIHQQLLQKNLIAAHVSVRAVQRFLKKQLVRRPVDELPTQERRAFETESFGRLWMADTCYFPNIKEGGKSRRTYLMCIVDDYSRMVVGARLFYDDSAYNFQVLLKEAMSTYGIPQKLYLDNGSPYKNAQLSYICASVGCVLIHTPVRDGAAKGKVERTFGTFKTRWLYGLDVRSISSLQDFNILLADYVRRHNLTKNESLGKSPMDRFLDDQNVSKKPLSVEWLTECFMNRKTRTVRKDGSLSINNQQFDADMRFIGQTVEVRFLPGDLEHAYIYADGQRFPLRFLNKVENSKVKRHKSMDIDYSMKVGESNV